MAIRTGVRCEVDGMTVFILWRKNEVDRIAPRVIRYQARARATSPNNT